MKLHWDFDFTQFFFSFSVSPTRGSRNVLKFRLRKISGVHHIRRVELVLTWRIEGPVAVMARGQCRVHFLNTRSPKSRQILCIRPSSRQQLTKMGGHAYLVLDVSSCIRLMRQSTLDKLNALKLRVTRCPMSMAQLWTRPLLVLYYVSHRHNKQRKDLKLRGALKRSLRIPRASHTRRPCRRCAYGIRKDHQQQLPAPQTCRLHQWYITLEQLQWDDWVVAPGGFKVNYCSGRCEMLMHDARCNTTNHARIRTLALIQGSRDSHLSEIPSPHCVPIQLKSTTILYVKNGMTILQRMDNMLATRCGCR